MSSEICNAFPNSVVITCDGNVILQCTGEDGGLLTEYSCNGQRLSSLSLNKQILVSVLQPLDNFIAYSFDIPCHSLSYAANKHFQSIISNSFP